MSKFNILIAGNNDPISSKGIDLLKAEPSFSVVVNMDLKAEDAMIEASRTAHAIIVRSGAKVTAKVLDAAPNLKVIGRAGVGVDNIDVPVASKRGVVVMNTPGGNTISTAEQAFTLMMALSRKTPQAHATIVSGKWDRKSFQGTEVYGKTLVVLGMGRIGAEFAKRAKAFGMSVVAYDPYLSKNRAESLGVTLCEDLDAAIVQADYITMHMPLTPETKHMINAKRLVLPMAFAASASSTLLATKIGRGLDVPNGASFSIVETVLRFICLKVASASMFSVAIGFCPLS